MPEHAAAERPARDLTPLLTPRSVAVVGASANLDSLAGKPVRYLRDSGLDLRIYPVNPRRDEIGGLQAYPDPTALPEAPDTAIVVVPAPAVVTALEQLAARGARSAIVVSSGFAELGGEGAAAQRRISEIARTSGMTVIGPNTLGVHDYSTGLALSFVWYGRRAVSSEGSVAVVSQSGSGMTSLCDRLLDAGLPLGSAVATGNESDLTVIEVLEHLATQQHVRVIAMIVEQLRDGPRFLAACARLHERGVALVPAQGGPHRQRHRRRGIAHGRAGRLLPCTAGRPAPVRRDRGRRSRRHPRSRRGRAAREVSRRPADRHGHQLGRGGGTRRGPGRRAWAGAAPVPARRGRGAARHAAVLRRGRRDHQPDRPDRPEHGTPARDRGHRRAAAGPRRCGRRHRRHAQRRGRARSDPRATTRRGRRSLAPPLDDGGPHGREATAMRTPLQEAGLPVFGSPGRAVEAIGKLAEHAAASPPVPGGRPAPGLQIDFGNDETEFAALRRLAEEGLPVIEQRVATTPAEAAEAAEALGFPVAVKIHSPDIVHKTEVGGVLLGLTDGDAVRGAFGQVTAAAAAAAPDARILGVTVAPMVTPMVELIAGLHRDPTFGPMVVLGLGGVWAEVLADISLRAVPVAAAEVPRMVDELRGAALLRGARGRPPVKIEALVDLVTTLSALAERAGPGLQGIDLNPVAVTADGGLLVLDASIHVTPKTEMPCN